jgi:hypothetical protein
MFNVALIKNKTFSLFKMLLILAFLLLFADIAKTQCTTDYTYKAYLISSTTTDSPNQATTEFSSAQYTSINVSDNSYTTSTAQKTFPTTCNSPTRTGSCTFVGGGDCGAGPGTCVNTFVCTAPADWCPDLGNTSEYSTCAKSEVLNCFCTFSGGFYHCAVTGTTCTKTGGCTYTCNTNYYDTDGTDSNGCESTTASYIFTFQRYTFNLSTYDWTTVTSLAFCWEGKFNTTGRQNSSELYWYNVSAASWVKWKTLTYNSESTSCVNFSGANLTSVYNSTGTWVQFAVRGNQSKTGHTLTEYADYAYLNVSYTPSPTTINVTLNSPQNNTWNTSQNIIHTYTPYIISGAFANCSLYTNKTGSWAYTASNATTITNNTPNTITYNYAGDYANIQWNVYCYNTTGSVSNYSTVNFTLKIDTTPPTYSSNSTNSTLAGTSVTHSLYWQDNFNLSGYIFSFDNCTGSLVNDSWVAMTGVANWSNVTKTINTTIGCTISWCVYANDTSNNWNVTSCSPSFNYTTTEPPTYSSNSTNSTLAGTSVKHSLYWQDDVALSGYIFSFDNCTGSLVNDSWVAMTGVANWSNVTKTINTTIGCTIRWCVYANDTSNNWNVTSCTTPFSYVTTGPIISTDQMNYSSCGAVFYVAKFYNSAGGLINSYFTRKFIDPNNQEVSSQSDLYPNNGTGIYLGSYQLEFNATFGTWLLKVIENSGKISVKDFAAVS